MRRVEDTVVTVTWGVELTRSELVALLAKLDIAGSACTLYHAPYHCMNGDEGFFVRAVEDKAHGTDTLDAWWNGKAVITIPVTAEFQPTCLTCGWPDRRYDESCSDIWHDGTKDT